MNARRIASLAVGLGISAIFLWLAARNADWSLVFASLSRASIWWALPLLAMLAGFCIAKAWRWAVLLSQPVREVLPGLIRAVLIGYGATSLLPMQLGELVRVWAATRVLPLRAATLLVSIAVERILDLLAVLVVLSAALLIGGSLPQGLLQTAYVLAVVGVALLFLLVLYVAFTERSVELVTKLARFLPTRIGAGLAEHVRAGAAGAATLHQPAKWLPLALSSLGQWGFMCGCIAASCFALDLQVPLSAYAAVLGLTIVGMSLPAGPGYVGSIQLAFALGLQPFGVAPSDAIAASFFYHVLVCGSLIMAGIGSMHRLGGRLRDLSASEAGSR